MATPMLRRMLFLLLCCTLNPGGALVTRDRHAKPRNKSANFDHLWRQGLPWKGLSRGFRATTAPESQIDSVESLFCKIEDCIYHGKDPEVWIQNLEALNCIEQPNRLEEFFGEWFVRYTNAPPPSNGQLGPFQGAASQNVPYQNSNQLYQNILEVPPNAWLSATLDGVWEEWDGKLLDNDENSLSTNDNVDWGKNYWKVTFLRLKIVLFGLITLINKEFPEGTSRVWRTTYLDDTTRIVRAGKTGRTDDEYVFYTKRQPKP